MKHVNKFLILMLVVLSITANAQIQELTRHSDLVIEGVVVSTESNWNEERTSIITENQVLVKSIFKGQVQNSIITIQTIGGTVDDQLHIKTHEINLSEGDRGYFFLNSDFSSNEHYFSDGRYGFAQVHGKFRKYVPFSGVKYESDNFEDEIIKENKFPKLSYSEHVEIFSVKAIGELDTCDILSLAKNIKSIEFTFDNVTYTPDFKYLEFDIMAKVNTPGLKFGKGDLVIKYDKAFGEKIVSNGSVEISRGAMLQNPIYDLEYEDLSENSLYISADSEFGSNQMYTFNSTPAELLHVKVEIADLNQLGTISFDNIDISGTVYYWCQGVYTLFNQVNLDDPIIAASSSTPIGIEYTFENGQPIDDDSKFSIDIMAEATGTTQYSGGNVEVSYNIDAFGSNVITSGSASFELGPLISNENVYTSHFVADVAMIDNVIQIFTFSDPAITSGRTTLGTTKRRLGTLIFDINDCDADKDLLFDQFGTIDFGNHIHYTGNMPIPNDNYNPVIANDVEDGKVCGCSGNPVITTFAPQSIPAGMGEILTINGDNFLSRDGESKIFFKNGDDGGLTLSEVGQIEIISWSNTKIEVVVPGTDKEQNWNNPPCSGRFEVHNRCGDSKSETELEIPYCILNIRQSLKSEKIAMQDDFCIGFSSDIPEWARNTFKTAMEAWCSKIDMNITVDYHNHSDKNIAALDGVSLVSNEVVSNGGGVASFVICNSDDNNNSCTPVATNFYIKICNGESNMFKEVDFKISDQALAGTVKSLQNVLVHEIGHALMLNHSTKPGIQLDEEDRYVMYYDQTNLNVNDKTRSIKSDDEEGAKKIFTNSMEAIQNCGGSPITSGNCNADCGTNSIIENNFIQDIELFPNPSEGIINIKSKYDNIAGGVLSIYTITGEKIYQQSIVNNILTINLSHELSKGIYVVEIIHNESGYWAEKIIVE